MIHWIMTCLLVILVAKPSAAQQLDSDHQMIVRIRAISGLQYDIVRFSIPPGDSLTLILTNTDEMEHNLVFAQPGTRENIVKQALELGAKGPGMDYIPESPNIMTYLPLLKPGESDTIKFRAPRRTGVYPYVCTFPGHGSVMYGAMHVTKGEMPQITADLDIPQSRRKDMKGSVSHLQEKSSGHPFQLKPPYLYRILLPDASPAAIAVHLPNGLSYCWDAGVCRLRYAWSGNFLDLTDYWTIKGELYGKILGVVFYRDNTEFPLRVAVKENLPEVRFKGYRLIRNYPEFHYLIDSMEVFEQILPQKGGTGLIRKFRILNASKPIWFAYDKNDGVSYRASKGKWEGEFLKLTPKEAESFIVFMTKPNGSDL